MHKFGTEWRDVLLCQQVCSCCAQAEVSGKREEEDAHLPDWRLRLVPKITSCSHTQDRQSVQCQTQLKAMRGMLGVQSTPIRHMTRRKC